MLFLFVLILMSASAFSLYLFLNELVVNPLVFVFLGWGTAVSAHYLSIWMDLAKLFVLNRTFQAFVVNGEGEFWNGNVFTGDDDHEPDFVYNDLQVSKLVNRIISLTGNSDLYIRIVPQIEIEE